MQEVYYVKEGRRYKPVSYYDSKVMDGMPDGATLVVVQKYSTTRRYQVDPAFAPLIAAGLYAIDQVSNEIYAASQAKPREAVATQEQRDTWEAMKKAYGNDMYTILYPSAREVAEKSVIALQKEAEKMLSHPAVKDAYDQFLLMCKLCKEEQKSA